jgi:ribosomal protein S27E
MGENNPLQKYFRQPAIYVKLPSEGKFYPPDTLDMPVNGEIPIYPMSALDEIITRTPDALFNGSAVIQLFQSCVPNIKDAWAVPQIDVDLLLTAIRIASYGHEMEMTTKCPKCEEEQDYALDLREVIDKYHSPDYKTSINVGDMEIYFRPLNYYQINETSKAQFQQQKMIQASTINEELTDEQRIEAMSLALTELTKMTMENLGDSIAVIKTSEAMVDNPEHIKEFIKNADSKIFARIREHLGKIREGTEMEPLKIKCKECEHEYDQPFTLDMSNFFV